MQTPNRARLEPRTRATGRLNGASATVLLCLGAAPPFALAAERDLGTHEHGTATLDIALDGARLYLDLDSPADNVLGFEHAPSTEAQRASLAEAERVLGSAGLFVPDAAAGCTLEQATVATTLPEAREGDDEHEDEHGDEHGDEHEDGHEDEAGHESTADHEETHADEHEATDEHGQDHERAAETTHADVTASHVLLCENPAALRTVATTLFERFSGFVDIDVQLVGPGGQDGARLTTDDPAVSLEAIL